MEDVSYPHISIRFLIFILSLKIPEVSANQADFLFSYFINYDKMNKTYLILITFLLFIPMFLTAEKLKGKILIQPKVMKPVFRCKYQRAGTNVGTTTNAAGYFSIKRVGYGQTCYKFCGYKTDGGSS